MPLLNKHSASTKTALWGIMAALALALSFLESLLPTLPVPGARLGLSNLVTVFALSSMGLPAALGITLTKAAFALLRGGTACLMSLCGGVLSTVTMALVLKLRCFSLWGTSLAGAVMHNLGQLAVALLLLDLSLVYYTPVLLLAALVAGSITGISIQLLFPLLTQKIKFDTTR